MEMATKCWLVWPFTRPRSICSCTQHIVQFVGKGQNALIPAPNFIRIVPGTKPSSLPLKIDV